MAESSSNPFIETQQLSKRYGKRPVVRHLDMSVHSGEVYALVGPNGAGKTTIIRLLTGLIFPSEGSVRILGVDPLQQASVKQNIGAVVEAPAAFYPYLTGRDNLRLHGKLNNGVAEDRISEVLSLMELGNAADRPVRVYSLGMRQRLGVAAAVMARPKVLILDEPASGMDPLSLHLVHRVLQQSASEGSAVLLSTHHLDEVATYCSRVGILEEGRLIDEVDLNKRRKRYKVRSIDSKKAAISLSKAAFASQVTLREDDVVFDVQNSTVLPQISAHLLKDNVPILEMGPDIFNLRAYYAEHLTDYTDDSALLDAKPDILLNTVEEA